MAVFEFEGDESRERAGKHEEFLGAQLQAVDRRSELLAIVGDAISPREARSALMDAGARNPVSVRHIAIQGTEL